MLRRSASSALSSSLRFHRTFLFLRVHCGFDGHRIGLQDRTHCIAE